MMLRRYFIKSSFIGLGLAAIAPYALVIKSHAADRADAVIDKLNRSREVWKQRLTPQQYDIMRKEGTERPFASALLDGHRKGVFACVGCDLPLFTSDTKFDSGTGWPSFFDKIPRHIETKTDYKLIVPCTEYHCARCGGHHGHVFNDGPQPTGLRHCNNGAVLKFIAEGA